MTSLTTVCFDLDRTLTDPQAGIERCIRFALAALNIEIDERVELASWIGPPFRESFQALCHDKKTTEAAIAFT